ncbi:MAG: hypothetical protein IKT10_05005 [Clostridiales bacterium]|nr:hypothetical protein [Clostridiales bacterium]
MYYAEQLYIVVILSIFFFLFACAGIAVFVTYRILNKYNDFGEVPVCSIHQYSNNGIKYTVNRDNVHLVEKNDFMLVNGDNPYENIERSIPEQLLKNAEKEAEKPDVNL